MIDDLSSNEGVTMEHGSCNDSRIDLDQDDDNNDVTVAFEKFVDQPRDSE